jgi:hypothetical protein
MFPFHRPPPLPTSGLLIALAAACALGCGENVLVTSWQLSLKAADAGAEEETVDDAGADAGGDNVQARKAQQARANAHREENRDKEADRDNHDEKSGH